MKNFDMKEMGERLRWLRNEREIGQNQLAELFSIAKNPYESLSELQKRLQTAKKLL